MPVNLDTRYSMRLNVFMSFITLLHRQIKHRGLFPLPTLSHLRRRRTPLLVRCIRLLVPALVLTRCALLFSGR